MIRGLPSACQCVTDARIWLAVLLCADSSPLLQSGIDILGEEDGVKIFEGMTLHFQGAPRRIEQDSAA